MSADRVPRLVVEHVSKTFGRRRVLDDVSVTVAPGEIHGIVGQNGSGKSTFVKAISGYHAPDAGAAMHVDGQAVRLPVRPAELLARGVSIVHQDLGLIEEASVVENVRIAIMRGARWSRRIDWRHERAAARAALQRLGYDGAMTTPVRELPPADRARVAIGRAIQAHQPGEGLIIFDESTRALPADALADFYRAVHDLATDGTSVLMIAHRLGEVLEHCDRVTVLRDGRASAEGLATEGLSESALATRMLGHELRHMEVRDRRARDGAGIAVRGLRPRGSSADPIDLDVGAGEVVGISGLPGSGFEAVPYLLAGAQPAEGAVRLGGAEVALASATPASLIARGIALVPENRPRDGLSLEHSVVDNLTLPWMGARGRPWWIGRRWQDEEASRVIAALGVRPPRPDQLVGTFSGGNAQKVLFGKWLIGEPQLMLLHEPTQGVDVQARLDLLGAVHDVAERGAAVLLASTEPEDLVTVCDRVLLFHQGAIRDQIEAPFDVQAIIAATYSTAVKTLPSKEPAHEHDQPAAGSPR